MISEILWYVYRPILFWHSDYSIENKFTLCYFTFKWDNGTKYFVFNSFLMFLMFSVSWIITVRVERFPFFHMGIRILPTRKFKKTVYLVPNKWIHELIDLSMYIRVVRLKWSSKCWESLWGSFISLIKIKVSTIYSFSAVNFYYNILNSPIVW